MRYSDTVGSETLLAGYVIKVNAISIASLTEEGLLIVVTGASGRLGQAVVQRLLDHVPANRIIASVRDPAMATALVERGIDVRTGNFVDPGGLSATFLGAEQVLIVSVDQLGAEALKLHRAAIDAARAAGVRRVLYTSHMGAREGSPFGPGHDHALTEAFLAEDGAPFTSLRHGFYAESALHLIGAGLEAGEIQAPEDGPVSWTTRADLAEADAIALAEEGRLDGITPPLTAGEAFTMTDLAAIASEVTGREIKRITLTDDAWRDATVAHGASAPMAEMLLGTYRAARRGDFATVDPTLEELLRRTPRTMRDVLIATLKPADVRAGSGQASSGP